MEENHSFSYLKPGTQLGKYTIRSLLGRGGMAEVYRAENPDLEQEVAIKVLHPGIGDQQEARKRFQREAKAAASLSHPNIVRVFDFSTEGQLYYMVMEILEGNTLSVLIDEYPFGMPHQMALSIFRQVASATGYAHEKGLIHRDIKPGNIVMIDKRAILMDFGLARLVDQSKLTATGTSTGTPAYMAPEQATGSDVTTRADIYSLGVLLYEMMAGTIPFKGDTFASVLIKHIQEPAPRINDVVDELPPQFEPVILRAMAKNPDDRYEKAADMLADLESAPDDLQDKTIQISTAQFQIPESSVSVSSDEDATVTMDALEVIRQQKESTQEKKPITSLPVMGGAVAILLIVVVALLLLLITGGDEETGQSSSNNGTDVTKPPSLVEGMVFIPGGTFIQGTLDGGEDEAPPREVVLDAYYIDQMEVTNEDYMAFVLETGYVEPATWAREGPSTWQITGTEGYQVGDFVTRSVYDGQGVDAFEDASLTLDLNADENTGTLELTFSGTIDPAGEPLTGEFRIVQTGFTENEVFHEGGIGDYILMHGDSGQETSIIPRIITPLATWGRADVYLDGEMLFENTGIHFMLTPGVHDEDHQVLKADGTCCYNPRSPADGSVDMDEYELSIMLFEGGSNNPYSSSRPGQVTVERNIWLYLYLDDVMVNQQPEDIVASFPAETADLPVTGVDWDGANAYCSWLDKRLPSEAEWEFAARGDSERIYPWGDEQIVDGQVPANIENPDRVLEPVGAYPAGASPFEVYDMAGNAWEWVRDWYAPDYYATGENENPTGPRQGTERVVRGGGVFALNPVGIAEFRTTARRALSPEIQDAWVGFRCAADVEAVEVE